jgi:4'-phosphopantetheinyl transferase
MKYIVKNINDINKDILDNFYTNIYEIKRNRISKDNYLSIYAEYLLCYLLKEYNIDYNDITILENENGKPYIKDSNIYYSISHSNEYVIVAIDEKPIGIDIQFIKDNKPNNFVLNEEEFKYNYIDIFSLKESYIKCIGSNINHMKDITFNLDNQITSNKEDFEFTQIKEIDNYVISICNKKTA